MTERKLEGRRVLITGASRGIGRAIAVLFAAEGARVAINYQGNRKEAEACLALTEAASARAGVLDPGHFIVQADVGKESDVSAMFDAFDRRFVGIDILINNAGIQIESPSDKADPKDIERVLRTNLDGAVFCSQAAIRRFLAQGDGGVIVNCSSVHQIIPKPGYLGYSLSKGAMGNLTRTLALEFADRGIRVNAVGPGATVTDINAAWTDDPEQRAIVEGHIPLGRAAEVDEVAAAFLFLASSDASYITGQTLYVCGGLTLYGEYRQNWAS
ncbi:MULTISPECIES: SDR family oxidoreductase [Rhodomicrobium]|uniref:SDR family oxidoreductase n=1 Tax=Rhodomicrobium TaxID=1068 RepID=UPI000B4AD150|nr:MULTISPECIES: SDR family oxidoreductase [Rhodomicrobium]